MNSLTRPQDDRSARDGLLAMQASRYVIPDMAPIDVTRSTLCGADFMKLVKTRDGVKNLGTCRGGGIAADTEVILYTDDTGRIAHMCIYGGNYPTSLLDTVVAYTVTESEFMRDHPDYSTPKKSLLEIKRDLSASVPDKVVGVLSQ